MGGGVVSQDLKRLTRNARHVSLLLKQICGPPSPPPPSPRHQLASLPPLALSLFSSPNSHADHGPLASLSAISRHRVLSESYLPPSEDCQSIFQNKDHSSPGGRRCQVEANGGPFQFCCIREGGPFWLPIQQPFFSSPHLLSAGFIPSG